eukprot:1153292-Pelagomonas_calceolata.AAC.1
MDPCPSPIVQGGPRGRGGGRGWGQVIPPSPPSPTGKRAVIQSVESQTLSKRWRIYCHTDNIYNRGEDRMIPGHSWPHSKRACRCALRPSPSPDQALFYLQHPAPEGPNLTIFGDSVTGNF